MGKEIESIVEHALDAVLTNSGKTEDKQGIVEFMKDNNINLIGGATGDVLSLGCVGIDCSDCPLYIGVAQETICDVLFATLAIITKSRNPWMLGGTKKAKEVVRSNPELLF